MRFHLGAIPENFEPDDSWSPIREPGPLLMQLCAVPIAIVSTALVVAAWLFVLGDVSLAVSGMGSIVLLWLSLAGLIFVHELLHAAAHPGFGRSPATMIGAWPSRFLFYAHFEGELSRNRFLTVFLVPFAVITVLPLLLAAVGLLPAAVQGYAAWYSIWNCLFSCGDLLGVALIWFQIPSDAIVRNKGWRTYWKRTGESSDRVIDKGLETAGGT